MPESNKGSRCGFEFYDPGNVLLSRQFIFIFFLNSANLLEYSAQRCFTCRTCYIQFVNSIFMFAINTHSQTHFLFEEKNGNQSTFMSTTTNMGTKRIFEFVSEKLCYSTYRSCTHLRHHLQKQN